MKRVLLILVASVLPTQAHVQVFQQAPPAVFRARADLVLLDVSVLAGHGRIPVVGLEAAHFTVFEDGKIQNIAAFEAVELFRPLAPSAPWMTQVAPDVTSNSTRDSRLFVLVMDDATMGNNIRAVQSGKQIARGVIDRLRPEDLMAVVFPRDNRHAQDFTNDHAKLLAAIDHYSPGFADMGVNPAGVGIDTDGMFKQSSIDTLAAATEFLATVPDRRKAIIYVSVGVEADLIGTPVLSTGLTAMANVEMERTLRHRMHDIFRSAQQANVTIYPIDPCGLPSCVGPEFLRALATNTGGYPVLSTNDFERGVSQIFLENNAYYLLGYRSTNAKQDGSIRRIDVKVNRPGAWVRTRRSYTA